VTPELQYLPLLLGALIASLTAAFIAFTVKWHGTLTLDYDKGVQKVHNAPTPRVGGIALLMGGLAAWPLLSGESHALWSQLLLILIPAITAGLLEDITGKVSPKWRLLATALGGLLFYIVTGYAIDRLGWGPLDFIENVPVIMGFLTIFAFAATANATNLVDGFHGLAGATIVFMALGLGAIAMQVDDIAIAQLCFLTAAIVGGFLTINYPWGKLFLGDGGAYTLGSLLAALGIALMARNDEVSPWALLVCFAYPAIETGFSIFRRRKRKKSISQPDAVHFHKLVWRAMARPIARHMNRPNIANPLTLYFIWPLATIGPVMASIFYFRTLAAMLGLLVVLVIYLSIYRVVSLQHLRSKKKTGSTHAK
jgi:UDP-N-acetylmuramyl pentapeptide phosphotransferase/UDP-N-acetylglucosamine-1-phosphate transferase